MLANRETSVSIEPVSAESSAPVRPVSTVRVRERFPVDSVPQLTVLVRGFMLLIGEGASIGLAVALLFMPASFFDYVTRNALKPKMRLLLLNEAAGIAACLVAVTALTVVIRKPPRAIPRTLLYLGRRFSPFGIASFLPLLFRWTLWENRDLQFLALSGIAALIFGLAVKASYDAGPSDWERRLLAFAWRVFDRVRERLPRLAASVPLLTVCAASAAYTAYFSYLTLAWHWGVHSGHDLALENNLMWNLVHGGPFFKSSPAMGPKGTYFGHDTTFFRFALAPIYAIAPRAETLLVVQATFIGFAAIPLFLFARRHVRPGFACVVSLAYLLYPPVHGANLYEFHYLPLSTFFLWLSLYALEARHDKLAALAVLLTLSMREDVALTLGIWGAYLLVTGLRPRVGLGILLASIAYFLIMKVGVVPRVTVDKADSLAFMYPKLIPPGEAGFLAAMETALGNPAYMVDSVLEEGKLVYLLQIFVPLGFVPMRRPMTLLLAVPGILFTLLTTAHPPTISIHYQYSAHWTTFMFVAVVLTLASLERSSRAGAAAALLFGLSATTYQFGSVLQTNTSWGGPIRYKVGVNLEDRRRHEALDDVLKQLPKNAKVSCSGFVTPQVSSRANAYSLTLGVYDAEYILFPSEHKDFIVDERATVVRLLESNEFGVVVVRPPFALARRGYVWVDNAELLSRIR